MKEAMKENMKVLVTEPVEQRHIDRLVAVAPEYEFRFVNKEEQPASQEDLLWADIILGEVRPRLLSACTKLRWMQTCSSGVDHFLKPGILPDGILLTNSSGAFGLAISEHLLAVTMSLQKKLELYRDAQHHQEWKSLGNISSIHGSTVLILGLGDIGSQFAMRCKALGATVIGLRRSIGDKPDYVDELYTTAELDSLLPRSDVVALTLPETAETKGLFSRQRIELMKPGSLLLNVGRGSLVDTEAVCDALESGHLAGAGLDVTDPEPLPKNHRLWSIPTALITPHISGFYFLKGTFDRIIDIFADNLGRFYRGESLINKVDAAAGYPPRANRR